MSRRGLRIPGRYERPAELRAPLGAAGARQEAGIRDGYVGAVLARQNARALERRYAAGEIDEQGRPIRESVATVESADTLERVDLAEAEAGGRVRAGKSKSTVVIDIIKSGWNKSGSRYYPADVLERDVPLVYPAGTHMYVNHPSVTEQDDRPERSLYDLAAVFTDTPYAVREGDQVIMRVDARVYSRHRDFLSEAKDDIGVSINGNGDGEYGTREGRSGLVLERLTHGSSVDFVTKPGAGGRIVALVESARNIGTVEAASLGAWLESRMHLGFTQIADELYGDGRLTRPERIAASSAVGDALGAFVASIEAKAPQLYQRDRWAEAPTSAGEPTREASVDTQRARLDRAITATYGGRDRYAWVRDFDPDNGVVWFHAGEPDGPGRLWQQSYSSSAGGAVLTGDRTEVRERIVFEPVDQVATTEADRPAPAAAQVATTQTPEGDGKPAGSSANSATTTAKESDMTDTTVKDAATREAEEATRTREAFELAQYRQADKARTVLDTKLAESDLPAAAQNRVRAQFPATALPLQESDRALDEGRFTTTVEAAIKAEGDYVAHILESAGVGTVTGNGAAAGAGSGIPAGFGQTRKVAGSATQESDTATTEALVKQYTARGLSEAAARAAAAGRN